VRTYCDEVRRGAFPTEEHAFGNVRPESRDHATGERHAEATNLVQAALLAAVKAGYGPHA
jgi:hypothetical protein